MTAGMYAARGRLNTLLIEKGATGGQVLLTDWVDNYPGFYDGISGFELMEKMTAHVDRFGLEKKFANVTAMDIQGEQKKITLESGEELTAQTVIISTGAKPRKLGVPGEEELQGKGVSYCATCDGPFYRNQEIAVVGGGNTAIQEALHLTKFASKVTVIHRRDTLRATAILQEKALAEKKIEFIWDAQVGEIIGKILDKIGAAIEKFIAWIADEPAATVTPQASSAAETPAPAAAPPSYSERFSIRPIFR